LLLYGGTIRANQFDLSIAPRDDARNDWGVFIEDQIMFNEHVSWNIGGRFDHFDTIGGTFSPRTSLIIKPNDRQSIRFAYNRAYRSPSLVNNFLETLIFNAAGLDTTGDGTDNFLLVFPTAAVGNDELEEETVDAFEIGYTRKVGERGTFTAAIYRNFTEDLIDFYPSAFYSSDNPPPAGPWGPGWPLPPMFVPDFVFPSEFTYRNVGKLRDQGLELSYNVDFNSTWSGVFAYSWQDTPKISDDSGSPVPLVLNVAPKHQASAGANFDTGKVYGSFGVSYTDDALWTDVLDSRFWGTTDDYVLINAGFGIRFLDGKMEFALNATNLADKEAKQHVFGDVIGRKITAKLSARW
jgi:outer membrane receptor protein involved in Fe transport